MATPTPNTPAPEREPKHWRDRLLGAAWRNGPPVVRERLVLAIRLAIGCWPHGPH